MTKLRTAARQDRSRGGSTCHLCGDRYERGHADVFLLDDGDELRGPRQRVCPTCVDAGPAGAAERIRERIEAEDLPRVDRQALRDLADEVERIKPADWASAEDLRAAALDFARPSQLVDFGKKKPVSRTRKAPWKRYRKSPT